MTSSRPQVAAKHYLQVTEAHFEKAVQNAAQSAAEPGRTAPQRENAEADGTERNLMADEASQDNTTARENVRPYREMSMVTPTGLEPVSRP